jgi:alginate O-acetyltransferase complex protein AlgI
VLFNSAPFAAFFACYLALHAITAPRYRLWLMIVGSTIFYGYWNWAYAGLPFALTLLAFFGAKYVRSAHPHQRWRLAVSIAFVSAPLIIFKYSNFFWNEFLAPLVRLIGLSPSDRIAEFGLPLGISFVTFTLLAYVIDVARGAYAPTQLKLLLAYVLFFPHLIAGPILRPHELIPQLRRGMPVMRKMALRGATVFSLGLVKKMAIADPIGALVTAIYEQTPPKTAVECLYAIYGFSVQIYCDFSGYTDMAIGLALILGVRLPNNFRQPYCATSLGEFWRRWHITLSHWLRDYVYISMGGSRQGKVKTVRNILVTMTLGGLWHGANWTFVIWGIMHGIGVVISHLGGRPPEGEFPARRTLSVLLTFHVVALLWVLFRAPNVTQAMTMVGGVFGKSPFGKPIDFLSAHPYEILLIPAFLLVHRFDDNRRLQYFVGRTKPLYVVCGMAISLLLAVVLGTGSSAQFIYFDF